jgi:hypothetical protein
MVLKLGHHDAEPETARSGVRGRSRGLRTGAKGETGREQEGVSKRFLHGRAGVVLSLLFEFPGPATDSLVASFPLELILPDCPKCHLLARITQPIGAPA